MGRIKTTLIKRNTRKLMEHHGDKLSTEFDKNKKAMAEVSTIPSKKLRNIIAGYATRLKRKEQDQ